MSTVTIAGIIKRPITDTPWTGAAVTWSNQDVFVIDGVTYPSHAIEVVTEGDGNGETPGFMEVVLAVPDSGAARYQVMLPDGNRGIVYLEAGMGPLALEDVIAGIFGEAGGIATPIIVRPTFAGEWDEEVEYSEYEIVQHNGSSYIVPLGETVAAGTEPPSEPWELFAGGATAAQRAALDSLLAAGNGLWAWLVEAGTGAWSQASAIGALLFVAEDEAAGRDAIGAMAAVDPLLGAYRETVVTANAGATYTIDWSAGTIFVLTLTDNTAVTMSNVAAGRSITVIYIQDGVGGRIPTYVNTIRWPGSAPVLSTAASARDKLVFDSYNGTVIDGQLAGKAYA
jgi:hypothetical protein